MNGLSTGEEDLDKCDSKSLDLQNEQKTDSESYGGARPKTCMRFNTGKTHGKLNGFSNPEDHRDQGLEMLSEESPRYCRKREFHRTNSSDSVFMVPHDSQEFFKAYSKTELNSFEELDNRGYRYHRDASRRVFVPQENFSSELVTNCCSNVPSITNSTISVSDSKSEDPSDLDNFDTIEDDCYIYTYRGGTAYLSADLPNSFFRLDSGSDGESLPGVSGAGQSNLSTGVAALLQDQLLNIPFRSQSPDEQDFLELDFDPGSDDSESSGDSGQGREEESLLNSSSPTGGQGSPQRLLPDLEYFSSAAEQATPRRGNSRRTSESSLLERVECPSVSPDHALPIMQSEFLTRTLRIGELNFQNNNNLPELISKNIEFNEQICRSCDKSTDNYIEQASTVRSVPLTSPVEDVHNVGIPRSKSLNNNVTLCLASEGTVNEDENILECGNRLLLKEALMFGADTIDVHEALGRLSINIKGEKQNFSVPKAMIWSDKDVCRKHVSQLGLSSSGAAAVNNVLTALNINVSDADILKSLNVKPRLDNCEITDYLLSRSESGSNHTDLINCVRNICGDRVRARFFPTAGKSFSISEWLAIWINRGCVPVVTINVKKSEGLLHGHVADDWHHQMIWGVSGCEIFLTNPLQVLTEENLHQQLNSPSELLIRREEVTSRFSSLSDLAKLIHQEYGFDQRWQEFNVLGQVVNLLREESTPDRSDVENISLTQHIKIPSNHICGITLFCDNSFPDICVLLQSACDF